jgi:SOS regulatory protein LexA
MLTKRQAQILNFIKKYSQKHGYSPSLEEIADKFSFSSLSTVHYHLSQLQEKGLISRQDYIPRSIQLEEPNEPVVEIPLAGLIAAGEPIEAIEQTETITVPKSMLSPNGEHYALKVKGNSMIDEGIFDNDIVVIRKQEVADNGTIVVALINGNEATLKKIYKEKNGFRLQPANPKLKPIFVKELLVQGRVVSILRNLEDRLVSEPVKENKYIFSDEYVSEEQIRELASRLIKFRENNLSKYTLNVKDVIYREEVLDSAILQNVFLYIIKHRSVEIENKTIQGILEQLQIDGVKLDKKEKQELENILSEYNLQEAKGDILGFIYQSICPQTDRKEGGQYYTPNKVVDFIIENVEVGVRKNKDLIILDPACGSGQFLLRAYDILLAQYKEIGLSEKEAHKKIIEKHLYGIDIDPVACALTKANLYLRDPEVAELSFNVYHSDFLKRDYSLIEPDPFQKIYRQIDFVIGNPPWGAKLSNEQKKYFEKYYEIGKVGLNTFSLFIERALDFLRDGGKLGFLIPEAYLKIKVHQPSRLQLLKNGNIKLLATGGEIFKKVYAPSLILVFEKNKKNRKDNEVKIKENVFNGHIKENKLPQSLFESTADNIFNIHFSNETSRILKHIDSLDNKFLKDNTLFILGIVTGNNKKFLVDKPLTEKHEPIIVGKDLKKYKINFRGNYFVYDPNTLQQVAPREYYEVPEKLIYKFIGKNLVFAYDNKRRFSLNNANAIAPKVPGLNIKYILALLNSKLIQFYYSKMFFTVRVLRGNLERLPLFNASNEQQKKIIELVNAVEKAEGEEYKTLMRKIDDEIFKLYKITPEWRNYIEAELLR